VLGELIGMPIMVMVKLVVKLRMMVVMRNIVFLMVSWNI
jgi:hypothetical protein